MIKYISIFNTLFINSLKKSLRYRVEFFTGLITDFCFNFLRVGLIGTLFAHTSKIGGWGRDEFIIFFGSSFVIEAIFMALFFNGHVSISSKIKSGDMDFILTKPNSTMFWLSIDSINFGSGVSNLVVGAMFLYVGINNLNINITIWSILIYIILMFFGLMIYFSISLLINLLGFWVVETYTVYDLFMNITDLYRYPGSVFGKKLNFAMIYFLPLQAISIIPAKFLIGAGLKKEYIYQITISICFLCLSYIITKIAIKSYTSASS